VDLTRLQFVANRLGVITVWFKVQTVARCRRLGNEQVEPAATLVGDRHAALRKAMREVGGAVERIDNPSMLALPRVGTALFGEDRVVQEGAAERPDDRLFGFLVGLGNEIDRVGLA
jgi:hypothetical protein